MPWTDNLPDSVRRDIREAGRGHLLGDYRSPLDVADEARKRAKEEPDMNTDKREALERAAGTYGKPAEETIGTLDAGRKLSDAIAGEGPDEVPEDEMGEDYVDDGNGLPADDPADDLGGL